MQAPNGPPSPFFIPRDASRRAMCMYASSRDGRAGDGVFGAIARAYGGTRPRGGLAEKDERFVSVARPPRLAASRDGGDGLRTEKPAGDRSRRRTARVR